MDGYEPPCEPCWEMNSGPLQGQPAGVLTAEPCLQTLKYILSLSKTEKISKVWWL